MTPPAIITMTAFFSILSIYVTGQKVPVVVSGKVISQDDSTPLEGCTINVRGSKSSTGTMPDGAFSLPAAKDDTLEISLDGYVTKLLTVTKDTYYEVILKAAGTTPSRKWYADKKDYKFQRTEFLPARD